MVIDSVAMHSRSNLPDSTRKVYAVSQVETEAQMAYLHYRLQQCEEDETLLAAARALRVQQLPAGADAGAQSPRVLPLQVAWPAGHSVMLGRV